MANQDKFLELLKEMFQLNHNDLDFGIYKVINIKSKEINEFIDTTLKSKISNTLQNSNSETNSKRLEELEKDTTVQTYLANPNEAFLAIPVVKEYVDLLASLQNTQSSSDIENALYNDLYNFFNRYYEGGDFISHRRYTKESEYSIPYNGEEVKLHWATADQYYIKSSENFKDYSFVVGDITVHFKLTDATTEQNNNKGERKFIQSGDIVVEDKVITIPFVYEKNEAKQLPKEKPDGSSLNEQAIKSISELEIFKENRELIEATTKHLKKYTTKNSFDYFIHKDLKGFLNRELDVYIKNKMLNNILDAQDIKAVEAQLTKTKVFKDIATPIIDFLAQIEEFQISLWLKKKFVYDCNYCITLDRIDSKYYAEILANEEQKAEWKKLFSVNVKTLEDLTPYLVLDTKFFSVEFKNKLLSEFDNLEEAIDGIMINSENFGALNLLQERYKEQVKTIYIDPPYNTDATPIVYKNGYKDSSWLSLMNDRIQLGKKFSSSTGFFSTAIDHAELFNLGALKDDLFQVENRVAIVTVQHNPKGRNQAKFFSENTEYMLVYAMSFEQASFNEVAIDDDVLETFTELDEIGKYRYENFIRARTSWSKKSRPNNWYPIYVSKDLKHITSEKITGYHELYPITNQGEFSWKNIKESFDELNKGEYFIAKEENKKIIIYHKYREQQVFKNLWIHKKYQSEFNGTNILKNIIVNNPFDYPKSVYAVKDFIKMTAKQKDIILDFFAGSGTTGHSTILQNREDGGRRKYILIEMGGYFETVTKPRIQKVIYTNNWKDGKPQDTNGISQIFKYFSLESYEDTLNNLEFNKNEGLMEALKDEYTINYMLKDQTPKYNIEAFKKPFEYKLNITKENESKETPIDLVETFNYLIGLEVNKVTMRDSYLLVQGKVKGDEVNVVWRRDTSSNLALEDKLSGLVYVNGDTNIEGVLSIEKVFGEKMWGNNL